jgi:anthranilate 1,2-dioxygenase small subunit
MTTNATIAERRELRLEIEDFNSAYARAIDDGEIETWPEFFTEDAVYHVTSRESHAAGLVVGVLICEGRGMFVDRVVAIRKTMVYAPRTVRHFLGHVSVFDSDRPGTIHARANFMIVESVRTQDTALSITGEYLDWFTRTPAGLLLQERRCVFDSMKLRAAIVYPI